MSSDTGSKTSDQTVAQTRFEKIETIDRTPPHVPEIGELFEKVGIDVLTDRTFQANAKLLRDRKVSEGRIELILNKAQEIVNKMLRRTIFSAIRSEESFEIFSVDQKKFRALLQDGPEFEALVNLIDSQKSYIFNLSRQMVESNYYDSLTLAQEGLSKKGLEMRYQLEKEKFDEEAHEDEAMVVVEFDINSFKSINDTIGHDEADKILKQVIGALRNHLRDTDAVGRRSGDEFTVILSRVKMRSIQPLLTKISEVVGTIDNGLGGKVSVTGGARIVQKGESIPFSEASAHADFAGIYEKINKPAEVASSIKLYEPDLKPDYSQEQTRRTWAQKVAAREMKREGDALKVALERTTDEEVLEILKQSLRLWEQEVALRTERKYNDLTLRYMSMQKLEEDPTIPNA